MIRLLGSPAIERDGVPVPPPRGHKAWAVLAHLVLAEAPVSRARLAGLLFGDAGDPLGALRWTLAQLRRALGAPDVLRGDPIELALPAETVVDVLELARGEPDPGLVRGELLEGVEAGAGPVFDAWLLVERRRLAAAAEAVLRDAALAALGGGDGLEAAGLASRALGLDPYDETVHELLVRCLVRAGEHGAARRHADACEELFQRELGRAADPRVRRALDDHHAPRAASGDRAAVRGQLEAGRAALNAGAVEPGIACLRHACAEARAVGDPALEASALAELGEALVHAVRGRDEEGAAVLHEALALAEAAGDRETAVTACRELGFVEVQAGRAASAGRWLLRASELASGDRERAAVLGVRGMALSDRGHYGAAIGLLQESIAAARRCENPRQAIWSLSILGRALVLRGDWEEAAAVLDDALERVAELGWIAFQPFPEALRAEVALRQGDPERATALAAHAFPLGCRLGDPCWEALAARVRGLLLAAEGDGTGARATFADAAARAIRVPDGYQWVHGHCLEALCAASVADRTPDASHHVECLARLAARCDMREHVVRAALHRAALGDPSGLPAARLLADAIDSPALHLDLLAAA